MAGRNRDLSIPWPFAPKEVKLNRDTNFLKIVAMVTMLIDHVGKMCFPEYYIMRIIGRIAFPIYAYCLTVGCVYTKNMLKYVERMLLMAMISQPLYSVALGHATKSMYVYSFAEEPIRAAVHFYTSSWKTPSIFLALTVGLLIIWSIRERRLIITLALTVLCFVIEDKLDYGWKGVMLMVLFYLFCDKPVLSFPVVAGFMLWWALQSFRYSLFSVQFGVQIFAMLALPLIYIPTHSGIRLNKWLFYWFYPAHLVLVLVLDKLGL